VDVPKAEPVRSIATSAKQSNSRPASPQPKKVEQSVDEKHSEELTAYIKRSRVPKLSLYLKQHCLPGNFLLKPSHKFESTPTLLHYAASEESPASVTALLTNFGGDPTLRNAAGRRPYDLAREQKTRDAFHMARTSLGESAWNWDAAGVGAALTRADIEARDAHERQQAIKERQRQLDVLDREAETRKLERTIYKHGAGKKLSSAVATGPSSQSGLDGLTPEARMRLERERRARAAEARLNALQGR
jgi:hypothetical protein